MLQHFGNFRVILRVNLTGRSRAKILQLQRQSQFLVHVFSQNRKLHRADFQYLLMKTFQIKVFAKEGLLFFFQIQKIQISHIVFQIISRCFGDISVNLGRDSSITDSEKIQEAGGVDFTMPILLGYTGLDDRLMQQYIQDSRELWQDGTERLDSVCIGSVIGTYAGPGAVVAAFFRKGGK